MIILVGQTLTVEQLVLLLIGVFLLVASPIIIILNMKGNRRPVFPPIPEEIISSLVCDNCGEKGFIETYPPFPYTLTCVSCGAIKHVKMSDSVADGK